MNVQATGAYRGYVDGYRGNELRGWVVRSGSNAGGVPVGLYVSGSLLARQTAGSYRADVQSAGIGDGCCGFAFQVDDTIIEAAEQNGGTVHLRVLDETQHEIGHYVLPSAASGFLSGDPLQVEKCRDLLYGDLRLFNTLLEKTLHAAVPSTRPKLRQQRERFFSVENVLPAEARPATELAQLPAYLEYTKYRMRKEREFDTEGNPHDRDHFLNWYLTVYGAARNGRRIPLTRDLLDYLNEPVVMGGQPHSLTRAIWWRLVREPERLRAIDPFSDEWMEETLYWWAWIAAKEINAEDCLVPRRYADALRAVNVSRRDDAFAYSAFMDRFHRDNPQYHFLNAGRPEDRQLMTLCLATTAVRRPDVLRFLPNPSLVKILERREGEPSTFARFHQILTGASVPSEIDFDTFAAILRLQGYDLHSHTFLSFTPEGHRLEAAALPPVSDSKDLDVQLIGPFEKASGLGQATRLSASILDRTGLSVNCVNFGLDNPAPEGFSKVGKVGKYASAKINLIHLNAEFIPLAFAYEPDVFSHSYNIGYFYWELNKPALCHYLGMDLLDEIWVSTDFGMSIYSAATEKPVVNVGMCYEELDAIDPAEARAFIDKRFLFSGDEFVFLFAFDSFSFAQRKNPVGVLDAFRRAFDGNENVRLVIKTQNRDSVSDPVQARIWKRIEAILDHDHRIVLMNETLTYEALLRLKAASDCYISLHKSEGWGFGMIEAMNLRVPVVCTAYSGNMEFCSEETAWLVDYRETPLAPDDYIFVPQGAVWAEPDVDDAAAKLRAVYADPVVRASKVEAAYHNVRENFSAAAIANRYRARLDEIMKTL